MLGEKWTGLDLLDPSHSQPHRASEARGCHFRPRSMNWQCIFRIVNYCKSRRDTIVLLQYNARVGFSKWVLQDPRMTLFPRIDGSPRVMTFTLLSTLEADTTCIRPVKCRWFLILHGACTIYTPKTFLRGLLLTQLFAAFLRPSAVTTETLEHICGPSSTYSISHFFCERVSQARYRY